MSDSRGHVELQRSIASIHVSERHRRDPGDLKQLMESLERVGLLQPVTITPGGYLICGYRRLEAARQLGWNTLRVWVRSGLSDELTRVLAERDDNLTHKPLTPYEAAQLFKEMAALIEEDAFRRQQATRFSEDSAQNPSSDGAADSAAPFPRGVGDSRRRAAEMITGNASYSRLQQILAMERIAGDRDQPTAVRRVANEELERIRNGGPVDPGHQRVLAFSAAVERMSPDDPDFDDQAAENLKKAKADRARRIRENRAKRAAAAATAKRSVSSFGRVWTELEGWSKHYAAEVVAREVSPDDWSTFLRFHQETAEFIEAVDRARAGSLT